MFVLDTDTLTLLLRDNPRVQTRVTECQEEIVLAAATRMEQLRGRFDAVFKAEDGDHLLAAYERLVETEADLARFPILPLDDAAAAKFDNLLAVKGLRRIGRGDLLIAAITLANKATLVTHNLKDFRKVPGLRVENWAD